jgi:hypothetical protein
MYIDDKIFWHKLKFQSTGFEVLFFIELIKINSIKVKVLMNKNTCPSITKYLSAEGITYHIRVEINIIYFI